MLEIYETICVSLRDKFSIFVVTINISYELVIVNFIEISSIHILFEKQIELFVIFWHKLKLL